MHKATANSHLHCFNYKIINNVLYLNMKPFQFGKTQSPLRSFCHTEADATFHVFRKYSVTKVLGINFPDLTPQAALFGFIYQ